MSCPVQISQIHVRFWDGFSESRYGNSAHRCVEVEDSEAGPCTCVRYFTTDGVLGGFSDGEQFTTPRSVVFMMRSVDCDELSGRFWCLLNPFRSCTCTAATVSPDSYYELYRLCYVFIQLARCRIANSKNMLAQVANNSGGKLSEGVCLFCREWHCAGAAQSAVCCSGCG